MEHLECNLNALKRGPLHEGIYRALFQLLKFTLKMVSAKCYVFAKNCRCAGSIVDIVLISI